MAFSLKRFNQATIGFAWQFDFFNYFFGRDITGAKSQNNFSFWIARIGYYLFGFPGDFVISERISWRDTFAIHDHKLFAQDDTDVDLEESMLPLFIYFVLEGELNATCADLSGVDKEKRYFIRSKWLFSDDVVNDGLRFVILFGLKSEYKNGYFSLGVWSTTDLEELGVTLLLISLLLFQNCSWLHKWINPASFWVPSMVICPIWTTSLILEFCNDNSSFYLISVFLHSSSALFSIFLLLVPLWFIDLTAIIKAVVIVEIE